MRLGITLRRAQVGHRVTGDLLEDDWVPFLAGINADWMILPNGTADPRGFVRRNGISHLLLSGGEDVPSALPTVKPSTRDHLEFRLLEYAEEKDMPVLGVCRGFQFVNKFLGGTVLRIESSGSSRISNDCHSGGETLTHAGSRHYVVDRNGAKFWVNSFHNHGVSQAGLAHSLQVLALSDDGWVEAARHPSRPWWGIQWHIERAGGSCALSDSIVSQWLSS